MQLAQNMLPHRFIVILLGSRLVPFEELSSFIVFLLKDMLHLCFSSFIMKHIKSSYSSLEALFF